MIYVRVNRQVKKGVLQAAFLCLQQLGIIQIKVNVVSRLCNFDGETTN